MADTQEVPAATMLDQLGQPYVTALRSRGIDEGRMPETLAVYDVTGERRLEDMEWIALAILGARDCAMEATIAPMVASRETRAISA